MGRPAKDVRPKNPHPAPGYREFDDGASMSSAMSLQEDIAHMHTALEDEDDTVPPPYTDAEESVPLASTRSATRPTISSQPPATLDEKIESWVHENWKGSKYTRLSPTLTTDPVALEKYIRWEAAQPPKTYIRVQGFHHETRRDNDGKNKRSERVDDFDFKADVTDTISKADEYWKAMVPVENETKTYRGTLLKARSPKPLDAEAAASVPTLKEWCHLFCASAAPMKTFTLRRYISGGDTKYLTEQITAILRDTRYRGNITVTYPLHHHSVTVISPHMLNRLRHNNFVWWACVLLQLWIITWPILFFMTKRWEVVRGEYFYSVREDDHPDSPRCYFNESEEQWCMRWKYTIQQSALSRVKCPKGSQITVPVDAMEDRQRSQADELARRNSEQQSGFVGGALALMRGASNINREMNSSLGWGYDC